MTAIPIGRSRAQAQASIPRIKFFSRLGIESVAWAFVIGHLVKWAVDALYFLIIQVKYSVGYNGSTWTVWYFKDAWDRAPVHISNLLHLHWFGGSQAAPAFWVTDRHNARDVVIGLVTGVIVTFLFIKPKLPDSEKEVGPLGYILAVPKAVIWAIPGIAIVGVLAWKLPWLLQHGWHVPSNVAVATEVNGYIAAGTWIALAMGIAGSQVFARFANRRAADQAQWFYAERSAAALRSDQGLNKLRTRVIGTPSHRVRVHWLLDNQAHVEAHSVWSVRILTAALVLGTILAGFGAWLTIAGPAAPH
jgi:hypothetical protein